MAFDASNISNLLWDSSQNSARDQSCGGNKLPQAPTIADGKVYIATSNCGGILVYGLLP